MTNQKCLHDHLSRVATLDENGHFTEYWECDECGEIPIMSHSSAIIRLQKAIEKEINTLRKNLTKED